jgi:hypothetical protein
MNRLSRRTWVALLALAVMLTTACGAQSLVPSMPGIPPTPSFSDQPTGSSPLSGDWNAKTGFGTFAFTVDPTGQNVTTAVVHVSNYTCGGTTLTTESQVLNQWPISGGEFAGRVDLGDANEILDVTFDGTYNAKAKTFSGTWEEDAHGTHCAGKWETIPHK